MATYLGLSCCQRTLDQMVRAIAAQEGCGVALRNQAEKFYYFTRIDHKNCGEVRNYFMFFRTFLFFSMVKKGCIKPY